MRMLTAGAIAIAMNLSSCPDAFAEWQLNEKVDAITDRKEKTAEVYNSRGYRFVVYRTDSGKVFGLFHLSKNLVETISPKYSIFLRVDKFKPQEIRSDNPLADLGLTTYFWEPGFVNFLLWHGNQEEGIAPIIEQLMAGSSLLVRYPVGTGGTRDVSFPLEGAKQAIAKALDLSDDPEIHRRAKEADTYKEVVTSYMDGCTKSTNTAQSLACTDKYLNCSKKFPLPDWRGLDSCLKF